MLAEHGLQLESIGGDIVGVPISALKVGETINVSLENMFMKFRFFFYYRILILTNYSNQS